MRVWRIQTSVFIFVVELDSQDLNYILPPAEAFAFIYSKDLMDKFDIFFFFFN
jgi:hypothetical protein